MSSFTLVTFNIRCDVASDGPDRWDHRRKAVHDFLFGSPRFDVIGLQEALPQQLRYLAESAASGWGVVGVGRDDGKAAGEAAPIFYRNERFQLNDSGTFWLSETPETPSFGWDAACVRICTWVRLQDRTGESDDLFVFNTHFDHRGAVAQERSALLLREKIAAITRDFPAAPLFLLGDFNVTPESQPLRTLAETLPFARLVSETPPAGPEGTFTGFDTAAPQSDFIDHIFVRAAACRVLSHTILDNTGPNGRFLSDHRPVTITAQCPP